MKRTLKLIQEYVPAFALISVAITLVSAILMLIAVRSPSLAQALVDWVGLPLRYLLAKLTGWLPFSLFELLLVTLPVTLGIALYFLLRRGRSRQYRVRALLCILGVVGILYSSYIYMLGCGYRTRRLASRLELDPSPTINSETLSEVGHILQEQINSLAEEISAGSDGGTSLQMSYAELSRCLSDAYDAVQDEYPVFVNFRSRVKPVVFSGVMASGGITGIYGYCTGEANISLTYPDYSVVYTAAHEMAHQRGIAREDEANFVAFLVTTRSTDPYIRYCGYLNAYEYVANALYRADKELYYAAAAKLSSAVKAEMAAYNEFYDKYRDSTVSQVSGAVNDSYLQSQGTPGTVSYGMVVDLTVAYYKAQEEEQIRLNESASDPSVGSSSLAFM